MLIKIIVSLSLVTLGLTACGGGGSDSEPVDINQAYSTAALTDQTPRTIIADSLSGSDIYGRTITGSINYAWRATTVVNGVAVNPLEALLNLNFSDGATSSSFGTSYFDEQGLFVSGGTSSLSCTVVNANNLPVTVKVGDFGQWYTATCSDGTDLEVSWRASDGGNGYLKFSYNATYTLLGSQDYASETSSYINTSGGIIDLEASAVNYNSNYRYEISTK